MERGWRTTRSLPIHSVPPKGQQLVGQTCTCPLSQPLHKDPTFIPSLSGRTRPMSLHLHPLQEDPTQVISSSPSSLGGPYPCVIPSPFKRTLPMSPDLCPPQEDPTHVPSSPSPQGGPSPCHLLISILSRRTLPMSSPHLHPFQEHSTHAPLSPAPPRGLYPCPFHPQPLWEDPRCPPSPAHQPGTLCKEHNIESLRDKARSPLQNGKGSELAPNHAPMWGFAASPRSCPLPSV